MLSQKLVVDIKMDSFAGEKPAFGGVNPQGLLSFRSYRFFRP
jgi:hypothetical protein